MGSIDTMKYLSISIDNSGTVIDKYRYFPFILFCGRYICTLGNVKKLACNFKKIFFRLGEIFKQG